MPPPFSAFPPPPPPPPQNGLALDYGGGLYAAGAVQGPVEAGGPANSVANVANSLGVQVSVRGLRRQRVPAAVRRLSNNSKSMGRTTVTVSD